MPQPLTTHHRFSLPQRAWFMILALPSLIIIWHAVVAFGVYSGQWQGAKTQTIVHWTPLPAATLNWRPLSYANYFDQRLAVEHYRAYLASTASSTTQPQSAADISATTLTKMIRLQGTENVLKKLRVTISDDDVNQAYTAQVLQNGDAEQVKSTIEKLYGWTPEQFKTNVIRPSIMRDKLQEKLSYDETISGPALQQAHKVLSFVKDGNESFSDLAKKYSDDVYGANGGDVGFVKQGEQVKEIDDSAFTLALNEVSDLLHTQYGYHIIKPIERKTVDGVDQVHLLQITILTPQVDSYLTAELNKSSIRIFVPGLRWDTSNGRVLKK